MAEAGAGYATFLHEKGYRVGDGLKRFKLVKAVMTTDKGAIVGDGLKRFKLFIFFNSLNDIPLKKENRNFIGPKFI